MTVARKWILVAVVAGSLVGGAVGGGVFSAASGNAASGKTTSTPSIRVAPSGTFKPIETKDHEAGESAAREAQEDAGQIPTVP